MLSSGNWAPASRSIRRGELRLPEECFISVWSVTKSSRSTGVEGIPASLRLESYQYREIPRLGLRPSARNDNPAGRTPQRVVILSEAEDLAEHTGEEKSSFE